LPSANTTKIALMFTVVVAVAIIAALSVSLYSVQSQAQEQPSDPENNVSFRDNEVRLVAAAADIEKRINESIRVMRLTSELAQVRSTDYLDSISIEHMGISEDKDIEKRTVAR
jgi:cell division protein FtsX